MNTLAVLLLQIGCAGALVTWLLLFPLRRFLEAKVLDIPNARSSHTRPTPRGGGLAVVVVTLGGVVACLPSLPEIGQSLLPYGIGAVLLAAISWVDDLRSLPNRVRFGAHAVAAIIAMAAFGSWRGFAIPLLGEIPFGPLSVPITFIWIVGLTNAYNFMDGIDGIAGGQAVVAGLGWAALGWSAEQPLVCVLGALLAGSSLGFLGHNWSPARVFMGDVCSIFLGYTFAVLPLMLHAAGGPEQEWSATALPGALLVWPFIIDTLFTFLRRLARRENVFAAHRSHLYQRLVIARYKHAPVARLYMGLALLGVAVALLWAEGWPGAGALAASLTVAGPLSLIFLVARVERQATSVSRANG